MQETRPDPNNANNAPEYTIFNREKLKNWKQLLCILIILVSLFLTSCDYYLNVLVLPKDKRGSYFIAKGHYSD